MSLKDAIVDAVDSAKHAVLNTPHVPEEAPETDAIALLKADHREVEALFKEILGDKNSALTGQRKNVAAVLTALKLHAKIEESIVYPAVLAKTKRDSDERLEVFEAFEEHGSMKDLIRKIERSTGRDETLKAKVQVLSEITEHHVSEEESEFFPEARRLLGEKKLLEIGAAIRKIKDRAKAKPRTPARRKKK